MKTTVLLLLSAVCLLAAGCGRIYGPVEEVKAFANEKEDVLLQMSKKLEASPDEAGIEEARKVLESRKEGLKAKMQAIKDRPQGINSDWQTMLLDTEINDGKYFQAISVKFGMDCRNNCLAARDKLAALEKDYMAAVKRY